MSCAVSAILDSAISLSVTIPQPTLHARKGERVTLKCQYTGVTDSSKILVQWHVYYSRHKKTLIWVYQNETDTPQNNRNNKFRRMPSDTNKEHAIQLTNAEMTDQAKYQCSVHYKGGQSETATGTIQVKVFGKFVL